MRPERYNVRESEAKWRKAWADAQETGGAFANPMRERTLRWRS